MTPIEVIEKHLPALRDMARQILSPKDNVMSRMVKDFDGVLDAAYSSAATGSFEKSLGRAMQDVWNEHCADTHCCPTCIQMNGKEIEADFYESSFVQQVVKAMADSVPPLPPKIFLLYTGRNDATVPVGFTYDWKFACETSSNHGFNFYAPITELKRK